MGKKVLLFALTVVWAYASPIIIGQPADQHAGNCIPFGCDFNLATTRYQQVYSASQFSGPINIGEIIFYADAFGYSEPWDTNTLATGSWTLYLSTTSKPVNGLGFPLDPNDGADLQLFATVISNGTVIPDVWIIPGNTFYYDPTKGNLLLDIHVNLSGVGNVYLNSRNGTSGGVFSRIGDSLIGWENYGLVTGFDVGQSAVPEPSSASLFLSGVGVLAFLIFSLRKD